VAGGLACQDVKSLPDYKPVSVLRFRSDSHSSWPPISRRLQRPTRKS